MEVIDFRKEPIYRPGPKPAIVDVPEMLFVTVDGEGAPEGNPTFQEAMQVLFGMAYALKFWDKKHTPPPGFTKFKLTPVEGLWWTKSGREFSTKDPNDWQWQVMLRLPDFVTPELFDEVIDELVKSKGNDIYRKALFKRFYEGKCVQLMYTGPYDKEAETIGKMHAFATEQGYKLSGKHHELYFSDPRRTAPEKLKTIIRHPVNKGG